MDIISESRLIESLGKAIEKWHSENNDMLLEYGISCYVGEHFENRMAMAALSVLFAIVEAQDYMIDNDLLATDELPM